MTADAHTIARFQLGSVAPNCPTSDSVISHAMMNQL